MKTLQIRNPSRITFRQIMQKKITTYHNRNTIEHCRPLPG